MFQWKRLTRPHLAWAMVPFAAAVIFTASVFDFHAPPVGGMGFDKFPLENHLELNGKALLATGDLDKARQYANELLDRAVESPPDWNYGNAVHHGNLILGGVALREGRVEDAERFLLRAGKTPGSPQLNSFGPNMQLAMELLEKGRPQRVLEYLQLCKTFWKFAGLTGVDSWIETIKAGGIPDFGANLVY